MSSIDEAIAAFAAEGAETEPEAPPAEKPKQPEASAEDGTPQAEDEPQEQEAPPEQPRDEKGRFVARDERVDKYLQRFDGDLDKALSAAVEADSMIGRQGQELGEYRKLLEQAQEHLTDPGVGPIVSNEDELLDAIERNPAGVAEWARQADPSGALYDRVMDAWFESSPRQAAAYERRAEYAQLMGHFQQQQAPLLESAQQSSLARAWNGLKREIPDLDDHGEAILDVAREAPEFAAALQSQNTEDQQRAIRNLYKLAKFEQANRAMSADKAQPEKAEEEVEPGFVATGGNARQAEQKTAVDEFLEEFDKHAAPFYDAGWVTPST